MYEIERLGHGGDGIAKGPIFAARTLPGEAVEGVVDGDRISVPKILTPSDQRVKPACPAYNRCGGCSLHHAADGFVLNWKSDFALSGLAARDIDASIRHYHTSDANSRRRAKLQGKRTKKGAVVGFYAPRSDVLQNIDGCLTLSPNLIALIPKLEKFTTQFASRKGVLAFWVLDTETGVDVAVDGLTGESRGLFTDLAAWAAAAGIARLTIGDEVVVTLTTPRITFGSVAVTPPPRGFTQATVSAEHFLQNAVKEAVSGANSVADLFAGCGTFGLAAASIARVQAFEGAKDLIDALNNGVRHAQHIKAVSGTVRDLFRNPIIPEDLAEFDGVIIDPPRAGAESQVRHLAASDVQRIAMVSCNPVTFARDVQMLIAGGYTLDWMDLVDQFRWSPHIEIVAQLTR